MAAVGGLGRMAAVVREPRFPMSPKAVDGKNWAECVVAKSPDRSSLSTYSMRPRGSERDDLPGVLVTATGHADSTQGVACRRSEALCDRDRWSQKRRLGGALSTWVTEWPGRPVGRSFSDCSPCHSCPGVRVSVLRLLVLALGSGPHTSLLASNTRRSLNPFPPWTKPRWLRSSAWPSRSAR